MNSTEPFVYLLMLESFEGKSIIRVYSTEKSANQDMADFSLLINRDNTDGRLVVEKKVLTGGVLPFFSRSDNWLLLSESVPFYDEENVIVLACVDGAVVSLGYGMYGWVDLEGKQLKIPPSHWMPYLDAPDVS